MKIVAAVPENILRLIPLKDRLSLGKAGLPASECRELECIIAGEFGRADGDDAGRYESLPWFERMAAVPVLFIDDLGKGAWSEAVREANSPPVAPCRARNER